MDRLGHMDDQITKNVYLHVTQEMKKEASQKFNELMRSFLFFVSKMLALYQRILVYQGFKGQITSCRPYRPCQPCQAFRRQRFLLAYQRLLLQLLRT
ncbi:hypothetical protein DS745_10395 [Anaerobacillus alkaliphilus]|uniref:Integrase n=1 Tax=Anaerobacillus alkaliphilus TaxID=1548597 RepID=A0A4Q0VTK8_9BACI|nr:hypothetical protein DS745_10395 [Anaerobacillus alkaliphilus]